MMENNYWSLQTNHTQQGENVMVNEVKFNGSQKDFFKAYPIEKRSFNSVYVLCNKDKETKYKFIGSLGENKFTRIENIPENFSMNEERINEYLLKIQSLENEISTLKNENEKIKKEPKITYGLALLNKIKQKRLIFGRKHVSKVLV